MVHHLRHGELVLSGGAGHHLVLGTFRFSISSHKADGKRWWVPWILALGPWGAPQLVLGGFSAFRLEPSLQLWSDVIG